MLRTKLFAAFAMVAVIVGVLSAVLGMRMIRDRVVDEAQTRVRLDLSSAWAVTDAKLNVAATVVRLAATKKVVTDLCASRQWDNADVLNRLELIRANFGLDFLTLVDSEGRVVMRAAAPHGLGDYRAADPAVARALQGEATSGLEILSRSELEKEADGLVERAFVSIERTPHARPASKIAETRAMVMMAAAPVKSGAQVVGTLYGGVLLNRNFGLVDGIQLTVFKDDSGRPATGEATLFLDDCRISTTVRLPNGNRALGTRASQEVSDRVLDSGLAWVGRAFVVREWYLSAYEPIRDIQGRTIGMLYVGLREAPFRDLGRSLLMRYGVLLLFGLVIALWLAYVYAGRLADPIHRLVEASGKMRKGQHPPPVPVATSCRETERLVVAFNEMSLALAERETGLQDAKAKLEEVNRSLTALNRSYMEMLGFVSHELKSPLATMMNYVYLLRQSGTGPLTEKQAKAVGVLDGNIKRIVEMARHYLDLSRIENGELKPLPVRLPLAEEIVRPILDSWAPELERHGMSVEMLVPASAVARADANMVREVFENLVSNAIKYGREGGRISLTAERRNGWIECAVRNEGPGIPPDQIGSLFQKFFRVERTAASRQMKGTGLGLFITRSIVEAHGGRIEVTLQPEQWTEFRFTLPAYQEE